MDIEHFYDANPRRRSSEELSFGRDWTDEGGTRWELNWVQDTGEVYLMREAGEPLVMDPFGDTAIAELPADEVTVEIIATVPDRAVLETALAGWSDAMADDASVAWARRRVAAAAAGEVSAAPGGDDPPPSALHGA